MKNRFAVLRSKGVQLGAAIASMAVVGHANAAIDPTVTDGALGDVAALGALMLTLTIAVTGWKYVKRTAS